jgi:RepB DNA-primase from phage plasmid
MARKFGGDPAATDSTRVLRLPGFINRKYESEFRVLVQKLTDRIHHLQDFRLRTEPIDTDFRAPLRSQNSSSSASRPLSQSEHDWAYAKRALARGDDPEDLIRRITDYRGEEKHSNYARYTVEKAQAALARN